MVERMQGMAAEEAIRQMDDAVELAVRRHEVFTEANRQIDRVTVTQRSPDGAVEVTVSADGNILDVRCTELIRTMPPHQVATTFQHCVQAAQAGVACRVEEILRTAAPGDPLTDELVSQAHKVFPSPATAIPVSAPEGGPRQLAIGGIEDDGPARPRRTPRRRPVRGYQDPDDWGGRPVLS
jgi:DNA-binding protein YbaB